MDQQELYSALRNLIGNPDPNQVSNRDLDSSLIPALEWCAAILKYAVQIEPNFLLVANQGSYPLPRDLAWIISVDWNQQRIFPTSTFRLDREQGNWRYASSGNPTEYAYVQGERTLYVNPAPSAAAIGTAASLQLRYISSTPGMDPAGTPGLSDLDQQLVLLRAAMRYLRSKITKDNAEEYQMKIGGYQEEVNEILPAAKRRAENPTLDYYPTFAVENGRFRAAR